MGDVGARRGDEHLQMALDAGQMGTWEWDVASGAVTWSPALERMHGLAPGTFGGTFEAYEHDIHPDDRRRVRSTIQVSATGLQPHHLEYRIVRPDAEIRWLEAHGRVVCDAAGRPVRMLGVCMDVTDRKQLERERERLADDAQRAGQFRDALLGVVAHDLRNPLAAISALSQWLARGKDLPPQAAEAGTTIAVSTHRLTRMVDELLDLAQAQLATGVSVDCEDIDLTEPIRRAVDNTRATHPGRTIDLRIEGEPRGCFDPDRVRQAVWTLLDNAVVHGEDPVVATIRAVPGAVVLTVHNRGTPIPADAIPGLFEPYKPRSPRRSGLGLGLYVASEIVRAHDGTIEVRSSTAEGTSFTITLPRARFSPPPP